MFSKAHISKDERNVASLLWMGRVNIFVSMLAAVLTSGPLRLIAVAVALLYPAFLVYCWPVVKVRRTEATIIAVISTVFGMFYLFLLFW